MGDDVGDGHAIDGERNPFTSADGGHDVAGVVSKIAD